MLNRNPLMSDGCCAYVKWQGKRKVVVSGVMLMCVRQLYPEWQLPKYNNW